MTTVHATPRPLWQLARSLGDKISAMAAQITFARNDGTIDPQMALSKNATLDLADVDAQLHCDEGQLWITRDGDHEDYIVHSGQSFTVRARDQVVVLSMRQSRLRFEALSGLRRSVGSTECPGSHARREPASEAIHHFLARNNPGRRNS
jgi:hypothetical protein